MRDEIWEEQGSVESDSVARERVRCAWHGAICLLFAVCVLTASLAGIGRVLLGVVSAGVCVLTYVLCFRPVNEGFAALSHGHTSASSLHAVALVAVFLHGLWTALSPSAEATTYVWLVDLAYALRYFLAYVNECALVSDLRLLSKGGLCTAETAPSNLKHRKVRNLCLLRPLDYQPEIAYASRACDPSRTRGVGYAAACVGLSFSASVIVALLNGFAWFVPTLTTLLCLCAALPAEAAARLPYLLSLPKLRKHGGVFSGFRSVERLGQCDTFVSRDIDFFPPGTVRVADLRFRASFNASDAVEYLAALLIAVRSPAAAAVLEMITYDPAQLPRATDIRSIPGDGVLCTVEGHTVMAGGRNLMLAHNIAPLSQSKEASLRSATRPLMYLSVDGALAAMVLLQYRPDPTLMRVLHDLKEDITVVIDTSDFNLTENLVRKAYRLDTMRVLIPDMDEKRFIERLDRRMGEKPPNPAMITCRKNTAVFYGTDCARDILDRTSRALTVTRVSTVLGLLITAAAALFVPAALSPLWVFLFQAVWALPVAALSSPR